MNERTLVRVAPLAGAAYAVASIAGALLIDRFPDSGTSVTKLASYYAAHHARVAAGGMVMAWAALLLALFGCALWSRAREAAVHPILTGAILVATAASVVSDVQGAGTYWILGHISTESGVTAPALQAWHVAGSEGGFGAGTAILLLAVGAAGILPRWLSWPAIVLGPLQLTPLGFFASLGFLLWAVVTGLVLTLRPRGALVPAVA